MAAVLSDLWPLSYRYYGRCFVGITAAFLSELRPLLSASHLIRGRFIGSLELLVFND